MTDGGVVAYAIVLALMGAAGATWVLTKRPEPVPIALYLVAPLGVVILGVLGTSYNLSIASMAIEKASLEVKAMLTAAGMSVAHYNLLLALKPSAWLLGLAAAVVGRNHGARVHNPRFDPLPAAAGGFVGLLGVVVWLLSGGAGVVLFLVGIGLVQAARVPREGEAEPGRGETYAGIAVLGFAGAGMAAWSVWITGRILVWQASARASAETRSTLIAMGEQIGTGALYSLVAAMLLLGVGLAGAAKLGLDQRSLTSTAGALALTVVLLGVPSVSVVHSATFDLRSHGDKRAEIFAARGIQLPVSHVYDRLQEGRTITISDKTWVDDEPVEDVAAALATPKPGLRLYSSDPVVVIEADGSLPVGKLPLAAAKKAGMKTAIIAVESQPGQLHGVHVHLDEPKLKKKAKPRGPLKPGKPLDLAMRVDGAAYSTPGSRPLPAAGTAEAREVHQILGKLKDKLPDKVDIVLVVTPDTTLQELVAAWVLVAHDPNTRINGGTRQLFDRMYLVVE